MIQPRVGQQVLLQRILMGMGFHVVSRWKNTVEQLFVARCQNLQALSHCVKPFVSWIRRFCHAAVKQPENLLLDPSSDTNC